MVIALNSIIYADILFIINTYINFLLLRLSGFIVKTSVHTLKLVIASILGGLYSFIILYDNINIFFLSATKIFYAAVAVFISYGYINFRRYIKLFFAFFMATVVFAGIMFFVWSFFSPESMYYKNSAVYFDIDAGFLIILTAFCYVAILIFQKINERTAPKNFIYELKILLNGRVFKCRAFLDSGNFLKEPFSNLPVIIVNNQLLCGSFSLYETIEESCCQKRYIVCSSLGDNTLLEAFKPDKIEITGVNVKRVTEDVYIAVTDRKIKNGEFSALLNFNIFDSSKKGEDYYEKSCEKTV